jgi:hypothetical protein
MSPWLHGFHELRDHGVIDLVPVEEAHVIGVLDHLQLRAGNGGGELEAASSAT